MDLLKFIVSACLKLYEKCVNRDNCVINESYELLEEEIIHMLTFLL